MQSRSPIARRVSLLLASLITIFATSIAHAQETSYKASFSQNKEAIAVNVLVGQSRVINFDRPVGRFSVSNPEIAEAVLVTPDQVLVNGKGSGQVNFIAWEQTGGQFLVFDVYVRANLSLIDSQIRALFPKDDIRLSQAAGSVVISGSVSNAATSTQVQSVVEAANFKRAVLSKVNVTVGQTANIDVALEPGQITESVTISDATSEIVETSKTAIATTIDQQRINNLPINERNYLSFALTTSTVGRDNGRPIGPAPTTGLNFGGVLSSLRGGRTGSSSVLLPVTRVSVTGCGDGQIKGQYVVDTATRIRWPLRNE